MLLTFLEAAKFPSLSDDLEKTILCMFFIEMFLSMPNRNLLGRFTLKCLTICTVMTRYGDRWINST